MIREKAVSDAIAGVTVGLTVIPQVLAFGKIRGSNFLINIPISATHYFHNQLIVNTQGVVTCYIPDQPTV